MRLRSVEIVEFKQAPMHLLWASHEYELRAFCDIQTVPNMFLCFECVMRVQKKTEGK